MAEKRTVVTLGKTITYTLERKQVKNVNLRIRKDGSVWVSAGSSFPAERIDAFVIVKGEMILRAQEQLRTLEERVQQPEHAADGEVVTLLGRTYRLRVVQAAQEGVAVMGDEVRLSVRMPGNEARRKRLLQRFMLDTCQRVFTESIRRQLPLLTPWGVQEPTMKVVQTRSRWGSCSQVKRLVHLSMRLIAAPMRCVDYVVLHELCHFVHFDHSPAFHGLMTRLMPDWPARRRELNGKEGTDTE